MSSGFVSGGTIDNETERDAEWKRAAQELEDQRRAKEDLAKHENDGKSLFDILQANKDKKQAEFEEKARFQLHNALNDDEADYLDSVLEKKRQEEASVRRETSEQLDAFRRQQEEAERKVLDDDGDTMPNEEKEQWAGAARKRKKASESGLLKGVKLRKSGSAGAEKKIIDDVKHDSQPVDSASNQSPATTGNKAPLPSPESSNATVPINSSTTLSLGLGYASSDED